MNIYMIYMSDKIMLLYLGLSQDVFSFFFFSFLSCRFAGCSSFSFLFSLLDLFYISVDVSKSGFLQLLKSESKSVDTNFSSSSSTSSVKKESNLSSSSSSTSASSSSTTPASSTSSSSGWKVLRDDYMMGSGKTTDWDKIIHSSEEEEDD